MLRAPVLLIAVLGFLARVALADCTSNDQCKAGRVCQAGACVAPPAPPVTPSCDKDVDCPGEQVCEAHRCVPLEQSVAPVPPSAAPTNPPVTMSPPPAVVAPTPPPPAQPTAPSSSYPPPPVYGPPTYPPPAYAPPPPPPPPKPKPPQPFGWKYDLQVGPGLLLAQQNHSPFKSFAGFGGAFDAEVAYGFQPNFGVGLRAGGLIGSWPTQFYYLGVGVVMPSWHWGLFAGPGVVVEPGTNTREWGGHLELPYEFPIGKFFKVVVAVGAGLYKGATAETLRVEIGF